MGGDCLVKECLGGAGDGAKEMSSGRGRGVLGVKSCGCCV